MLLSIFIDSYIVSNVDSFIDSYIVSNVDSYIDSFIAMLQTIFIAILQPFFNSW